MSRRMHSMRAVGIVMAVIAAGGSAAGASFSGPTVNSTGGMTALTMPVPPTPTAAWNPEWVADTLSAFQPSGVSNMGLGDISCPAAGDCLTADYNGNAAIGGTSWPWGQSFYTSTNANAGASATWTVHSADDGSYPFVTKAVSCANTSFCIVAVQGLPGDTNLVFGGTYVENYDGYWWSNNPFSASPTWNWGVLATNLGQADNAPGSLAAYVTGAPYGEPVEAECVGGSTATGCIITTDQGWTYSQWFNPTAATNPGPSPSGWGSQQTAEDGSLCGQSITGAPSGTTFCMGYAPQGHPGCFVATDSANPGGFAWCMVSFDNGNVYYGNITRFGSNTPGPPITVYMGTTSNPNPDFNASCADPYWCYLGGAGFHAVATAYTPTGFGTTSIGPDLSISSNDPTPIATGVQIQSLQCGDDGVPVPGQSNNYNWCVAVDFYSGVTVTDNAGISSSGLIRFQVTGLVQQCSAAGYTSCAAPTVTGAHDYGDAVATDSSALVTLGLSCPASVASTHGVYFTTGTALDCYSATGWPSPTTGTPAVVSTQDALQVALTGYGQSVTYDFGGNTVAGPGTSNFWTLANGSSSPAVWSTSDPSGAWKDPLTYSGTSTGVEPPESCNTYATENGSPNLNRTGSGAANYWYATSAWVNAWDYLTMASNNATSTEHC